MVETGKKARDSLLTTLTPLPQSIRTIHFTIMGCMKSYKIFLLLKETQHIGVKKLEALKQTMF